MEHSNDFFQAKQWDFFCRAVKCYYWNSPQFLVMILSMFSIIREKKTLVEHETITHDFWYWLKAAVKKLLTEWVNYVLPNSSNALLCKLYTLRNWHFALLYWSSYIEKVAGRVWNRPVLHCKRLIIDFYGLCTCDARSFTVVSGDHKFAFGNYALAIITYWPLP